MKATTVARQWSVVFFILVVLSALTGCGDFFISPHAAGGGGGTTTGNYVYVANGTTDTLAGYSIGTGTLTAISGSPLSVGYAPLAVAVTPSNTLLYVAGAGAIYVYKINSNGSLTGSSGGAAVAVVNVASLAVSPDGQWLFGLDVTTTVLDEFKIDPSTGALAGVGTIPYVVSDAHVAPKEVRVAPTGNFVFAALGTGGDVVFTLNTTTGAVATSQHLALNSSQTSDNGIAIDSTTSNLFIARSGLNGGVAVYSIGAAGALTQISGSPFSAGSGPASVVLDKSGKYVYVANRTDATISGYSIGATGALSALRGSPYTSGTLVTSLGTDKTGAYILAGAFGGSPDLSMYTIGTTNLGQLALATSTATGMDPAGVNEIALTH
ncbi:lactonase family protein [Edaphobacter bradus]|uniref:lactonase family protein n=1 Tax=Edaphobacter bradus TaxID=2259016 RepID=UPI0021E0F56A|nr:lactonase family protein [Edaphobacter bradus]